MEIRSLNSELMNKEQKYLSGKYGKKYFLWSWFDLIIDNYLADEYHGISVFLSLQCLRPQLLSLYILLMIPLLHS